MRVWSPGRPPAACGAAALPSQDSLQRRVCLPAARPNPLKLVVHQGFCDEMVIERNGRRKLAHLNDDEGRGRKRPERPPALTREGGDKPSLGCCRALAAPGRDRLGWGRVHTLFHFPLAKKNGKNRTKRRASKCQVVCSEKLGRTRRRHPLRLSTTESTS